jgi:hypothetical protein
VGTLATMWQRIPGHVAADIADRSPLSYSLLLLPHPQALKPLGVGDDKMIWGRTRDHPFAKWTTKSFVKDTTLKQALVIVGKENEDNARLLKIRLTFLDGVQMTLERTHVSDPSSLVCVSCYDPSAVYRETTQLRASQSRMTLVKQLKALSDHQGRITTPGVNPPKTFSPEVLYRDCPPPQHQQPGYNFTPMSHVSYMTRPNVKLRGVRPGVCDTAPAAIHFRPRAFMRSVTRGTVNHKFTEDPEVFNLGSRVLDLSLQAEVVDQRNILSQQQLSPLGTLRTHSSLRPQTAL